MRESERYTEEEYGASSMSNGAGGELNGSVVVSPAKRSLCGCTDVDVHRGIIPELPWKFVSDGYVG